MGVFDFLKSGKKGDVGTNGKTDDDKQKFDLSAMMTGVDSSQMSGMQKMAFKMFQKLSPEKQQDIMRQALNPQNIQKNKDKILKQIDEMIKTGQIEKGQAEAVKSQLGLR